MEYVCFPVHVSKHGSSLLCNNFNTQLSVLDYNFRRDAAIIVVITRPEPGTAKSGSTACDLLEWVHLIPRTDIISLNICYSSL